jgi:uncharacterized protein (TIGR02271 family)
MPQTTQDILSWRGHDLVGRDGNKIGSIEEIYIDDATREPEWALVTTGLFGSKRSFVPIAQATADDGEIRVPFDKDQVKDSPGVDPDGELSQREEAQLYRHYGMEYSESQSESGLPEGGAATGTTDTTRTGDATGTAGTSGYADGERGGPGGDVSGPNTDNAMTRSEEELDVGTTQREAGRARLRKYVVEDEVTKTVPVRREEVRVEREPITDANVDAATDGPAISEEEHEVVLHEEEPVVEKRAVPKERVRMEKDAVTEDETVSEELRKERIDSEGDVR